MSSAGRKNLVVVRAGRNSLHPAWLERAGERNWDLIVSAYDPEARFDHGPDVPVVLQRGGKWDGLHALFADGDLLSRYDYIWLPDDDIAATCADINAIFDAMRRYGLAVAQPALTHDSYFTHFALMACPGFTLRYTNFIEIMVPCLKSTLLAQVIDDFRDSMSGYGMDTLWCRLSAEPRYKAAILDTIAVRHTRPVGKVLRGNMAGHGQSPEAELQLLRARYLLPQRIRPMIYAAIDGDGRRRLGCKRLGLVMAFRYLKVFRQFQSANVAAEKIVQLIRRQTTGRLKLSPLQRIDGGGDARLAVSKN